MKIDQESAPGECDCDYTSIKIRVEDFLLALGGLARLPWSVQRKVLDSRLDDAVQISSSGFNVFARGDNLKKRPIQELPVNHGIPIVPAWEEQLLTEAPGKRIDTFPKQNLSTPDVDSELAALKQHIDGGSAPDVVLQQKCELQREHREIGVPQGESLGV